MIGLQTTELTGELSIARRAKYSNTIQDSLIHLKELEEELEADFLIFMPQLKQRCDDFLKEKGLD